MPNFIEIEETFCGWTNGDLRPALLGRLCRRRIVDLKTSYCQSFVSVLHWVLVDQW